MMLKPALSIDDQIHLLRTRGMIIEDENETINFLSQNHYYRLNIYFHKLMANENQFMGGVCFSQVIAIYENDRLFRRIILSILEPIEINMRSQISNHLAILYDPGIYYRAGLYKNDQCFQRSQEVLHDIFEKHRNDPVIIHHREQYEGRLPIWVIVEYLSFHQITNFFRGLCAKDKKIIAHNAFGINEFLLGNWLFSLSILRNICAHYGYLYRRKIDIKPAIEKSTGWDQKRNEELFALFLVFHRLTIRDRWKSVIETIRNMESRPFFNIADYGFPAEYMKYIY